MIFYYTLTLFSFRCQIYCNYLELILFKMLVREFKSKPEVIAYVQTLGIEETILLGNLWLEIKDKVTSLEQNEIIVATKLEKEKAIIERETAILNTKNQEIKVLQESLLVKDSLILDKENERKLSNEQLAKKDDEIKQHQASLLRKDEEINAIRSNFNLERHELKVEKDKSLDEMRLNNSKQIEEKAKKIIELQR